ncbi:MAG: hypothetical protein AB7Y46_15970 [Armatimonadota bacterium]
MSHVRDGNVLLMADEDQPRLPIPLPDRVPRRRGSRRSRPAGIGRRQQLPTLMPVPILQRCGRCGRLVTVLDAAAVCRRCGGLVLREDGDLD